MPSPVAAPLPPPAAATPWAAEPGNSARAPPRTRTSHRFGAFLLRFRWKRPAEPSVWSLSAPTSTAPRRPTRPVTVPVSSPLNVSENCRPVSVPVNVSAPIAGAEMLPDTVPPEEEVTFSVSVCRVAGCWP